MLLHCTTTQSIGGTAFSLLPKLLKKDQDEQGQHVGITPALPSTRAGEPQPVEAAADRRDGTCLSKS